jgi:hypothetical protein
MRLTSAVLVYRRIYAVCTRALVGVLAILDGSRVLR